MVKYVCNVRETIEGNVEERKNEKRRRSKIKRIQGNKKAAEERWYGVRVEMHPVHQVWCEDEKEDKYTEKVRSFLSELRWLKEEPKEGGITWIELYALYSIHGK